MEKVTGIKSVDFKIKALGHGVVNWNGPTTLTGDGGKTVDNHTLPKLRGYTNLTGKTKEESGYKVTVKHQNGRIFETGNYTVATQLQNVLKLLYGPIIGGFRCRC